LQDSLNAVIHSMLPDVASYGLKPILLHPTAHEFVNKAHGIPEVYARHGVAAARSHPAGRFEGADARLRDPNPNWQPA
jgi:hypothetical protein